MAKSKRWYALRPIKLNESTIPAGKFLSAKEEKQIPKDLYRVLVKGCRVYDMDGEIDTKWSDRGVHRLRLRCLFEIGTPDSEKVAKLIAERNAGKRREKFDSHRETELAAQIAKTTKNPEDVKPPEAPVQTDAVEDLLGD